MLTITGPGWVCHGNCAPGCTVILATTVREGSWEFETSVAWPSILLRICSSTSSVNTARCVSTSTAIGGGGGVCACSVPTATAPAATAPATAKGTAHFKARMVIPPSSSRPLAGVGPESSTADGGPRTVLIHAYLP